MEIRVINGQQCTDRNGAAEYLHRSKKTIELLASTKMRAKTGWPQAVAKQDRKNWYSLADLDAFRVEYLDSREESGRARVHQTSYAADPDTLITDAGFRELIQVGESTWRHYIAKSKPAWEQGKDGYLPLPEPGHTTTVQGGERRKWRQHRAADWINNRQGPYLRSSNSLSDS